MLKDLRRWLKVAWMPNMIPIQAYLGSHCWCPKKRDTPYISGLKYQIRSHRNKLEVAKNPIRLSARTFGNWSGVHGALAYQNVPYVKPTAFKTSLKALVLRRCFTSSYRTLHLYWPLSLLDAIDAQATQCGSHMTTIRFDALCHLQLNF